MYIVFIHQKHDKQKEFTELWAVFIVDMGRMLRAFICLLAITSSFVTNDFYFMARKKQVCPSNRTTNLYSNERNSSHGVLKQRLSGYACFLYLLSSAYIWSRVADPPSRTPRTNMIIGLPGLVRMYAGLVFLMGASLIAAHSCNSAATDPYPVWAALSIVSFWAAYYVMKMLVYSRINPYIESPTGPCSLFAYRGFGVWWVSIWLLLKALLWATGLSLKVAFCGPLLLSLVVARRTARSCQDKGLVLSHEYTPIIILLCTGAMVVFLQSVGDRLHDQIGITNAVCSIIGSLGLLQSMLFALRERVDISGLLPLVRR